MRLSRREKLKVIFLNSFKKKVLYFYIYLFIYLAAPSLSCSTWNLLIFPWLGSNLGPLQWECRVLATRLPGSPSKPLFLSSELQILTPGRWSGVIRGKAPWRRNSPLVWVSEGNIQSEHKMDILGNAKQILHTEEKFSSHLLPLSFCTAAWHFYKVLK